jgi:hypothetical protein
MIIRNKILTKENLEKKRIGRVGRIAAFVVYLSLLTIYSSIVGG